MSQFVNYNTRSVTLPVGCEDLGDLLKHQAAREQTFLCSEASGRFQARRRSANKVRPLVNSSRRMRAPAQMLLLVSVTLYAATATLSRGQQYVYNVRYRDGSLEGVLVAYGALTKKQIIPVSGTDMPVTMFIETNSRSVMIAVIRATLLTNYGLRLREEGDKVYPEWVRH